MRFILIAFLLAFSASAQTKMAPDQMRLGLPDALDKINLWGVGLTGTFRVQLGAGLKLEWSSEGKLVIKAEVPVQAYHEFETVLERDADGNYKSVMNCKVYRNGQRLVEGLDYKREDGKIKPVEPWSADDIIVGAWVAAIAAPLP